MAANASDGSGRVIRIGAMADLHCTRNSQGQLRPILQQVAAMVDLLLIGGDLTDHGLPEETKTLAHELNGLGVPVVAVLGNHDFEAGQPHEVRNILAAGGITMLDGEACETLGVGIAGGKGFAGGFGRGTLGAWGEDVIKRFVQEAVDESLRLESALARLRTPHRIALLHYSPIEATVVGEPREIFPFLGCGRLADPIARYPVAAVFHGHAHRGTPAGEIVDSIPVYNVAMPLLRRLRPDQPPVKVIELSVPAPALAGQGG